MPAGAGTLCGALQPYATSAQGAARPLVVEAWLDNRQPASLASLSLAGAQIQFAAPGRVQCRISGGQLAALAALPGVASVTLPSPVVGPRLPVAAWKSGLRPQRVARVRPQQGGVIYGFGPTVSEGVQLTNASAFQANGIAGSGATIAVIAEGFAGFVDAEIPPPATVSFRADGSMGDDALGTATAEVAADMAPQASFTLIAVDTALSLRQAINYVAANRFTTAISTVGTVEGPFDGSDLVSQALVNATAVGVFWVQASGDLAQRHWQGTFQDNNGDGFADIGGGTGISLNLPAGVFTASLSWYETAGQVTAQDYDLQLYQGDVLIADSGVAQNGNTPPAEMLLARVPAAGVYDLRIKVIHADLSKPDKFQLYTPDVDMPAEVAVAASSLPAPAMVESAFTVGATAGSALAPVGGTAPPIDAIEPYSSQGPTITGLMKPDMVGPDRVSTSLAAYTPFLSTAAGAAHVGGAAGLLFSEDHSRTAADFKRILFMLAVPLPSVSESPNDIYGHGRLSLRVGLDTEPPSITILFPQNSTTISSRTPLVRAKITDLGTGVNAASIALVIDTKPVTGFVYDPNTGLLSYLIPDASPLTLTRHQISLTAADNSGNVSPAAVVNFRVALPTMDAGIHLFSLPYTFAATKVPTPNELFGLSGGVQLARWWAGDSQYHYYPDPYASFDPPDAVPPGAVVPQPPAGLGYFVNLPQAVTLSISGIPVSGVTEYDIRLLVGSREPKGWNMVGCPFLSPVDFGSVQFVTNGTRQTLTEAVAAGVTDGVLFAFRSTAAGGFYTFPADPFSAVIEPFQGYWLHVLKDTTMVIYPPAVAMQTSAAAHTEAGKGWRLQLVAAANGSIEPCNFIGMNSRAGSGYSPLWAVSKPPPVDPSLRAALVEKDWGDRSGYYAQVIKPAAGRQEWEMEVACSQPNSEVSLRWPELNATVPAGVTLMLQDLDTGEEVYMRTSAGYTFNSGPQGGTRRLRLVASTDPVTGLTVSGVSAQGVAGGGVAFTYALSQPAEVSAEIRNISGALIKRFGAKASAGGAVELLVWNGRSDRGSKVPAGRYLVRLTAQTDKGQTVQAIRPFEVLP
jgi:hypothetical protein